MNRPEFLRAAACGGLRYLLTGLILILPVTVPAQSNGEIRWVASWGTALALDALTAPDWMEPPPPELQADPAPPSPIPPYPALLSDQTVRMIARVSVGGDRLRLLLSNALGSEPVRIGSVHVALHAGDGTIVAATDRAVRFGGREAVAIPPGAQIVSDPIALGVPALAELAVSVYLPGATATATTHDLGLNTTYIADGNAVARSALAQAATNRSLFWLDGIEVQTTEPAAGIVAFGDSITDGFMTTPDRHQAWPALLANRLQSEPTQKSWAVINMGVSGNRIRRDHAGRSGLARFDRDVLARAGVEWIILMEGINDITFSALPRAPAIERTTAEEIIEALALFVDRAHARGLRVMGATLMPMSGLWLYNPRTEAMRQTVNVWIRAGGKFDAVVDFDAATRDPDNPARLLPAYDSGDHIHPNDAGNAAMAAAIDLAVFSD